MLAEAQQKMLTKREAEVRQSTPGTAIYIYISGVTEEALLSPLPPHVGSCLGRHFYREKTAALSSLVDSDRSVLEVSTVE